MRAAAALAVAFVVVAAAATVWRGGGARAGGAMLATRRDTAVRGDDIGVSITVSNAYERSLGFSIGDGLYPFENLVEMWQATRLVLHDGRGQRGPYTWSVDGTDETTSGGTLEGGVVEVRFVKLGVNRVRVTDADGLLFYYDVTSKYVRRELRDLSEEDRERYFDALHVIYNTAQDEGEKRYGKMFRSANWLVREHLYGAAQRDCDHWHDDAGFLTHHVGITLQFEQSLRAVDPRVCSHYWDYTVDARNEKSWMSSEIFSGSWYGVANPSDEKHVVNEGRFAYTPVMENARDFSNITNPYGLLRSPWNTNPTPYLMRHNRVVGVIGAQYVIPTCDDFVAYIDAKMSLGDVISALNGELHGPVHIMIGGHWGFSEAQVARIVTASSAYNGSTTFETDQLLLASKFLWRQGYIECPQTCSHADESDCSCSINNELWDGSEEHARTILTDSGLATIGSSVMSQFTHSDDITDEGDHEGVGLKAAEFLALLGHVGYPGEMFTSAAPQDPIFWSLHGLGERFVQLLRLADQKGVLALDSTWGYTHAKEVMSDTAIVCDWSNISDTFNQAEYHSALASCTQGDTCPGHREDDLLPFANLLEPDAPPGSATKEFYTNKELYDSISPWNKELPYVYDKLTTWPACPNGTLFSLRNSTLDDDDDSTGPAPSAANFAL